MPSEIFRSEWASGAAARLERRARRALSLAAVVASVAALPSFARAGAAQGPRRDDFVQAVGPELRLGGREFEFAGANTYYLAYKSPFMVDDDLERAGAQGFSAIRTWGWIDIGNQDGTSSVAGTDGRADGSVYYHYWNGTGPAFNDGANGLEHLDYVVYRAGQLGIKLVIPFVNNWTAFGGMDQYVRWLNATGVTGQYHDQFYTDATIRGWYKDWISHLLTHRNSITGVAYKDDPTIMAWELGNEPRCTGSGIDQGGYPSSSACTTQTLVAWADDVSKFVKSVDRRHLLEVGDEGFYCTPGATDWTEDCSQGVDTIAFASLPHVDMMSFHLYPDGWGKTVAWGTQWIARHFEDARKIHAPAVLGEFGILDKTLRNPDYKQWTDTVLQQRGAGALYWMLAGEQDDGTLYPDFDGFTVYCPSPVCTAFSHFAATMQAGHALPFGPVADNDVAVTMAGVPVTLSASVNDVAYNRATIAAGTLDLDPATPGRQSTVTLASGNFAANPDGTVVYTPAGGFFGTALAPYVIDDSRGRTSTVANLTVTVKGTILPIESFESGTDGWVFLNAPLGTVAQTSAFATDGSFGLQVNSANPNGDWLGVSFATAIDLTGKNHILADIEALTAGTSTAIALKAGAGYTWCQTPSPSWGWINPGTTGTVDLDLGNLDCLGNPVPDLSHVHAVLLFFSGPATYYLDNVRAQE